MLKYGIERQLPLLNHTIAGVQNLLQTSQITAVELAKCSLKRAADCRALNAYITISEDNALQQARIADEKLRTGKSRSPLDGVTVSIKDNFNTNGVRTTAASKMLENYTPIYDATVVKKLLHSSGSVMVGKANMDEFAMGSACSESFFGPAYNPWHSSVEFKICDPGDMSVIGHTRVAENPEDFYIAGGSSGGSAISVAMGSCFAALSSDTGGSTRNPASRVGIVGFKPSYGALSRFGLIPLTHSLDCPGILARTVDDVSVVFEHIQGVDENDSTTFDAGALEQNSAKFELKNLKIGIPDEYFLSLLSDDIRSACDDAIQMLVTAGAEVVRVSLPHTKYSLSCYSILNTSEVASNFACYDGIQYGSRDPTTGGDSSVSYEDHLIATREKALNDIVKARIIAGNFFLLSDNYTRYYSDALKIRRLIAQDFEKVFQEVDFLFSPVTITSTMNYRKWSQMDKTEEAINEDYCTQPANMAGIPALSLPFRLDSSKQLPVGVQIMANRFQDRKLLQFGVLLEKLFRFPCLVYKEK